MFLSLSLTDTHIVYTHLNISANVISTTLTILSVTSFKNLNTAWLLTRGNNNSVVHEENELKVSLYADHWLTEVTLIYLSLSFSHIISLSFSVS